MRTFGGDEISPLVVERQRLINLQELRIFMEPAKKKPYGEMLEAEDAYRAELVREYGEHATSARLDTRGFRTPELRRLALTLSAKCAAFYGD